MHKDICIDLDGTIIFYDNWVNEMTFGEVLPDAINALGKLKANGYTIIIYTTRTDKSLVSQFLNSKNIPFDYINENPNQPANAIGGKPIADIYVDDRGLQFQGNWNDTLKQIMSFKTWQEKEKEKNEKMEYGKQFLFHDFEQCFEQLRHYDSQCWDIIKFCFGEVLLAITAIWAVYCFSETPENASSLVSIHFNWLMIIILFISYLFVFISSYLVARNRVYYVKSSRYINELRKLAIENKPYGFKNTYNFYSDHNFPKVNERMSTQLIGMYALILLGVLCFTGLSFSLIYGYLNSAYRISLSLGLSMLGYLPFYFCILKYLKTENIKMKPLN